MHHLLQKVYLSLRSASKEQILTSGGLREPHGAVAAFNPYGRQIYANQHSSSGRTNIRLVGILFREVSHPSM
jgi:hypothetical protein